MDRIISMIINQIIRRFVNAGITKGISHFSKGGANTPADQATAQTGRDTLKRARQAQRITRRLGR
jgi:hypothetical protein